MIAQCQVKFVVFAVLCTLFICETAANCIFPKKKLPGGKFIYQSWRDANLTVASENYLLRFKCARGYALHGDEFIVCNKEQWTSMIPTCIKLECMDPPNVLNGNYVLNHVVKKTLTIGTRADYTCNLGFEMENSSETTLLCDLHAHENSVQWYGEVPFCKKKISCGDPGVSADGQKDGDCCFIGDVLEYSCNEDFVLVGSDSSECLEYGNWSTLRPLCKPLGDHCDHPPRITNGVATGRKSGDYYLPYDEVEVLCRLGYAYQGASSYVMCDEETGWDEEFGECTETFCGPPKDLANGTIPEMSSTNETSFPFNHEITYTCDKGFKLIGDSWRFCDTNGWTGKNPHCEEIRCPDPGVPENGRRMMDSNKIGEKVLFSCTTGYDLLGSFERYCMPNGQWSGDLTRCDHPNNYCPDPGVPVNGMKNGSKYEMGSAIHFKCQPGFGAFGSPFRVCMQDRTWSGIEVKCKGPYDFDNAAQVRETLVQAIAAKEAEQKHKLKVYNEAWDDVGRIGPRARRLNLKYPGRLIFYFAFDVSGSVGKKNFRRSVEFAKAIVRRVGITEKGARAGALTFSSKVDVNFMPMNYNSTEDVIRALNKLNYTGGGTSASSALETLRKEVIPTTQEVLLKKDQKSIIFILTDGKANMGGDPQVEAKKLREEVGAEIYCIGVTSGDLQDSLYGIASDKKEEHVFILQNYGHVTDLVQAITTGNINYSACGLGQEKLGESLPRGRIAGGERSVKPWPWMAALFFKDPDLGKNQFLCGGSIIDKDYIMTAAHCLYKKEEERDKKDLIVKLGVTDLKNETNLEEFEVTNILMHPGRRISSADFFDFDIALLHLKRPIEFNAFIRPVCLPPLELEPQTTLYKAGQYSVATGWGHAGIVEKNQKKDLNFEEELKEIRMPVQSAGRCNSSAQEHSEEKTVVFTERMICAGDGQGGNDTCQGDSGGPLMQSQQHDEGYKYWVQVGIVSFGYGCGLPNTYGYYTNVQKFSDWITTQINTEIKD